MGLKKLLRKYSYWRLSRSWRVLSFCRLQLDCQSFYLNGLSFGSVPAEASQFGRPQRILAVAEEVFKFEFRESGLILEYEKGHLNYIGVIFDYSLEAHSTFADRAAELCVENLNSSLTRLDRTTSLTQVLDAMGPVVDDRSDAEESLLIYHLNQHVLEFEFLLNGRLARFNLFPE
ncbi:MAG: hypothetical protein WCT05_02460 [Lentisphaeria bacterium]